jgi:carbon-monoxide dehydrogenase small subunit
MDKLVVTLWVNDEKKQVLAAPNQTLVDLLRNGLGLTGTKQGCGEGDCGCCTVLLDGEPVNSCLMLAAQAEGRRVTTIEGLADENGLHPLQESFVENGAIQCGFCTPGMILSASALLSENPAPGELEIRGAISGNICRCTGYHKIVQAVGHAASKTGGR